MVTSRKFKAQSRAEPVVVDGGRVYDGFISYSHAADGLLAPRLQSALQRFAKPWWKRRAVRIFRDESSLSANPHLWSSITEALDASGWFVLLLSPDAARSEWVNQEISYWVGNRDHKKILPVVTDGAFGWDGSDVTGDAVPGALRGVFDGEPRWVDVRWARDEDQLDLKDPRFADAIADIASTIRGIPKDDLASEEVRQHRRTVRTAWAAGGLVTVLAIAAVGFGIQSLRNAEEAERQAVNAAQQAEMAGANAAAEAEARAEADLNAREADRQARLARARELASSAIGVVGEDTQLSILLALEALQSIPDSEDPGPELERALREAVQSNSLIEVTELASPYAYVDVSPDGRRLAVTSGTSLEVLDANSLDPIWDYSEQTADLFQMVAFSSAGSYLTVSVMDQNWFIADHRQYPPPKGDPVADRVGPDGRPARLLVLDADTGRLVHTIEFEDEVCAAIAPPNSLSESLGLLAVGVESCAFWDGGHELRVYETSTWQPVQRLPAFEGAHGVFPSDPEARSLAVLSGWAAFPSQADVYDVDDWDTVFSAGGYAFGALSPDGSTLAAVAQETTERLDVVDIIDLNSGRLVDRLPIEAPVTLYSVRFTASGDELVVGTIGERLSVYSLGEGRRVRDLQSGHVVGVAVSENRIFATTTAKTMKVWDLTGAHRGELETQVGLPGRTNGILSTNSTKFTWQLQNRPGVPLESWMYPIDSDTGALRDRVEMLWATAGLEGDRIATFAWDPTRPDYVGPLQVKDLSTGETSDIRGCWLEIEIAGLRETCDNGDVHPVGFIFPSVDGREFAIVSYKADVTERSVLEIWDSSTLEPIHTVELEDSGISYIEWVGALAPDHLVLWDGTSSEVVSFERLTGRKVAAAPAEHPYAVDGDGSYVYYANHADSEVKRSSIPDMDTTSVYGPFPARVSGIAVSPNGDRLAVVSFDDMVRVVEVDTGALLDLIPVDSAFAATWIDENHIGVGGGDRWTVVTLDRLELEQIAVQRLSRSFSDEECGLYAIDPCPTLDEIRRR